MDEKLTHVDDQGNARMVDVGHKPVSLRTAVAEAKCEMQLATAEAVRQNGLKKGDVLQVARIAAIGAAKRTDELIPLCHSLPLDTVDIDFLWENDTCLTIKASARTTGKTGVEMEAMVAASIASLTVYDMCKAMDRSIKVKDIVLVSKTGGVRGDYQRSKEAGE